MTRINTIHPCHLSDKHLVAAWYEYPRILKLVLNRIEKCPENPLYYMDMPAEYTLGKGHCHFFYNKLTYIISQLDLIYEEMRHRDFSPSAIQYMQNSNRYAKIHKMYPELCNTYTPSPLDKLNNLSRLIEREPHNTSYKELYQSIVNQNYPLFKNEKVTGVH